MQQGFVKAICLAAVMLLPVAAATSGSQPASADQDAATMLKIALKGTGAVNTDPTKASDDYSWAVLDQIYDGLGALEPSTGHTIPWLAESWTVSSDSANTNVSVKIRSGATFHDGSALNADDVVASYNNADTKANPRFAAGFTDLLAVSKVDATNVKFVFAMGKTNGNFYSKTLTVPITPDGKGGAAVAGSGAFMWGSDKTGKCDGSGMHVMGNEKFYGGLAGFDGLHFTCFATDKEVGDKMTDKSVDLAAFFIDANQAVNYSGDHLKVNVDWGKEFTFLAINSGTQLNGVSKITSMMRQGIALSVQKYTLTTSNNGIYKGSVLKTSSALSPSNTAWYVPGLPDTFMPDYDDGTTGGTNVEPEPEELVPAAQAFDAAGAVDMNGDGWRDAPGSVWNSSSGKFDMGGSLSFTLAKPSPSMQGEPRLAVVADLVAVMLRHNQIDVKVVAYDIADLKNAVVGKNYDIALLNTGHLGGDYVTGDPAFLADAFKTGGPKNYFGYSDAAMDSLAATIEGSLDQGVRAGAVSKAAFHIANYLPVDPLFFTRSYIAFNKESVEGVKESVIHGHWGKVSIFNARPVGAPLSLNLDITSAPTSLAAGEEKTASIKVTSDRGLPIEGASVKLMAHGAVKVGADGATVPGGTFSFKVTGDLVTAAQGGSVMIDVSYRGIPGTSDEFMLVVYPNTVRLTVKLSATPATAKQGDTVTVNVDTTVVGTDAPAAKAKVSLMAGSGISVEAPLVKEAGADGKASFTAKVTTSVPGTVEIRATVEYAGATGETGSGSGSTSVTVSADTSQQPKAINTPGFEALTTIAALGLAFVGVTLLAARRRK